MARRCVLSGKGVMAGMNVSHANNKTKRRFLPNLQSRRLYCVGLNESVRLRISANSLRTIEKHGGLDGYLVTAPEAGLPADLRRLKRRLAALKAPAS